MGYGLFGKVPQKRDYLAVNLPPAVLAPFEAWLAAAVMASRQELGERWEEYYLVAPIWRFWLDASVFGTVCAGAIVPSVDQGGRYFPVAVIYVADKGETIPSPLLSSSEEWYVAIDSRLLRILSEDDDTYLAELLVGLTAPQSGELARDGAVSGDAGGCPVRIIDLGGGGLYIEPERDEESAATAPRLGDIDRGSNLSGSTYWWRGELGSNEFTLMTAIGLPDPAIYGRMLLFPKRD